MSLGKKGQPVAIGRLERFVGDYAIRRECSAPPVAAPPTGRKVAVVGSGPAGLTCAVDLAKLGHKVTIFESLHAARRRADLRHPRVPSAQEHHPLRKLRPRSSTWASSCGPTTSSATPTPWTSCCERDTTPFSWAPAPGCPCFMRIPGINLNGVMSANEFLTRVNLMKGYRFPELRHAGQGGPQCRGDRRGQRGHGFGTQRSSACRCTWRQCGDGRSEVHIVYRRSSRRGAGPRGGGPSRRRGGRHLRLPDQPDRDPRRREGQRDAACAAFAWSWASRMPPAGARPLPIEGSEFDMTVDTVIFALGTSPNPIVFTDAKGLERTQARHRRGRPRDGPHEAGRACGPAAMSSPARPRSSARWAPGKRAAADMHKFLDDRSQTAG